MKTSLVVTLFIISMVFSCSVRAATCSCAGVPLLNSMDASSARAGNIYFNATVENHVISDLVSGSEDIDDETGRDRSSQSLILEVSYGVSELWSVSAMVSAVRHNRQIGLSDLGKESSQGAGDGVVLAKYTPLRITPFKRNELGLGLGAKIPIGEDNVGDGIVQAEDMQPSTGAWGLVLWANYNRAFDPTAKFQIYTIFNSVLNGENSRNYRFGHEANFSAGIGYQAESRIAASGLFRYRVTGPDQRNNSNVPNTGGQWLDFVPSVQYSITEQFGTKLSARIPVYRKLKGALQFTTSYSYSVTMSYSY